MPLDRRRFLLAAGAYASTAAATAAVASAATAAPVRTAPISALGVDATHFGVRPGSPDDQTRTLQRAIDQAAGAQVPLTLPPGVYRAGNLKLQNGTQLIGVRGATRLMLSDGTSLISANGADRVALTGIVLDAMEGEVRGTTIIGASAAGLFSLNARGLLITGNTVRGCGNNGIQVWRSEAGDDGTLVIGNRIEDTFARNGGSGQNGNAVNVFRAANVVVSQNRIKGAAFSAVRGNAASNLQITGNNCSGCGEVALYAEFGFEGAVIATNTVDGAAIGIAVTNFNDGGRLAVVQGNVIRNLTNKRPAGTDPNDGAGIGIGVEADTAVTGNVIEDAPSAGISVGWSRYLRDVTVTGNVVRRAGVGISVSVSPGAGATVIADNLIAEAARGAIVGMDEKRQVTGDLAKDGAARYAQLAITGNRVR
jgi:uncharacterized secreted repeat protein (TIGR03808 family)